MANHKLRIFHVCYGGLGGHNTVVTNLALQHQTMGIFSDVVLVAPYEEILQDKQNWPGFDKVWPVTISRRGDIKSMWRIFQIIRLERPEVVICHLQRHIISIWLGQLSLGMLPKIVFVEHHAISLRSRSSNLWSLIGVILAKAVVVLTPDYVERYRWRRIMNLMKKSLVAIPNGVSMPKKAECRIREKDSMVIGMAARLVISKDLSTVIKAIHNLNRIEGCPRYLFLIAGDGPLRSTLELEVKKLELTSHVNFLGNLNRADMDKFYRSIDVYVHSTQAESFGMAVIEAASYGVPIVASRVEGVVQQFEKESIELFTFGDNGDLEIKLRRLENPDISREMAERARDFVLTKYESNKVARQYLSLVSSTEVLGR